MPSAQGLTVGSSASEAASATLTSQEQALVDDLSPDHALEARVRAALAFNRDFRVTLLRVQEARSTYRIVKADQLPTLAAGVQRDRQHFANRAREERYGQELSVASLGISDYELDFFGRVKSLSDAARHHYLATEYGQQAARSALVAEVARGYLGEQLAAQRVNEARQINDAQRGLLERIERLQQDGVASIDDVSLQRIDQLNAQQQVEEALRDQALASQAMLFLTGYAHALPAVRPDASLLPPQLLVTPAWLADLPSTRLLERFDVRQREEALKAANADIGAARAAFFPSIKLSTGAGIASDSLASLFSSGSGAWLFNPQVSLPLFDGGRNRANLDAAIERKNIAVAEYEKTIQVAFRQVAGVLAERRRVLSEVRSESALRSIAQEKLSRQSLELDAGSADGSVILQALIRIATVEMALNEARYDLLLNRLDIYRTLCGADPSPSQSVADSGVPQ